MTDKQRDTLLRSAMVDLRKTTRGYKQAPNGVHWRRAFGKLDRLQADMSSRVPELGPIRRGGKSVLLHDCTHITSGLGWPAFDDDVDFDSHADNLAVLAPEDGFVDDATSGAAGGDAFYFTGQSGIRYWVGHITTVPKQNRRFKRGSVMTRVSEDHPVPHVHLGLDARKLLGGKHLKSHRNYTHGAPTIGVQLAAALEA